MDNEINIKLSLESLQLIGRALLESHEPYIDVVQVIASLSEQVNKSAAPKNAKKPVKTKKANAPKKPRKSPRDKPPTTKKKSA